MFGNYIFINSLIRIILCILQSYRLDYSIIEINDFIFFIYINYNPADKSIGLLYINIGGYYRPRYNNT